jgi:SOS-response transcriptional repressor LexA
VRELGEVLGIRSSRAVQRHIAALIQAGQITHEPGKVRTLRVTPCDGHPWRPLELAIDGAPRPAIIATLT